MELAAVNNGLTWEHYNSHWQLDMQYNIDKPDDLFKPWGFQPGHQVEWTKLLLTLMRNATIHCGCNARRIRTREGATVDKLKSPPGKTNYHTMGACWDVLTQQ